MKSQPYDKNYVNNGSRPNPFMLTPVETDVRIIALAYSWWETYDLVLYLGSSFNEPFTAYYGVNIMFYFIS